MLLIFISLVFILLVVDIGLSLSNEEMNLVDLESQMWNRDSLGQKDGCCDHEHGCVDQIVYICLTCYMENPKVSSESTS